jgi:hypothetical protein
MPHQGSQALFEAKCSKRLLFEENSLESKNATAGEVDGGNIAWSADAALRAWGGQPFGGSVGGIVRGKVEH